jgi:AbiV family abortive infection protein
VNRTDLQTLTETRLREAKVLLDAGEYSGAYYLCGYVVECAIKACIAKRTTEHDFPDKKRVEQSYSHDISNKLLAAAGLQQELESHIDEDADFAANWAVVKDWTEESRYEIHDQRKAGDFYTAVADATHGVLAWLKTVW